MSKARDTIKHSLFLVTAMLIILLSFRPASPSIEINNLPQPNVHPLPLTLEQWQNNTDIGDYFEQIKPTSLGYLIWSNFPIRVYLERPSKVLDSSASSQRFEQWVEAVVQAMEEWHQYLPLVEVGNQEQADVVILRSHPPLEVTRDEETGGFKLPRARSAQTRYEFYVQTDPNLTPIISHRCTIYLSPSQTTEYTLATARHELGHALGLWGHSTSATDVMYFSQVRNPPAISRRDINTLKKIYQQPTQLGWTWKN